MFRVTTLIVSLAIGLLLSSLKELLQSPIDDIPPVEHGVNIECGNEIAYRYLVISVPADDELYLGRQKLELSQICESIEQQSGYIRPGDRLLFN